MAAAPAAPTPAKAAAQVQFDDAIAEEVTRCLAGGVSVQDQ